jgi:hypothetical protein
MQSEAPAQLTTIPPKPKCMPQALTIFGGGPVCQDQWNAYNQAVEQRKVQELQLKRQVIFSLVSNAETR